MQVVLVLQGVGGELEGVVGEVDSGDPVAVTEVGGEELVTMATVRPRMVVRDTCKVFQ